MGRYAIIAVAIAAVLGLGFWWTGPNGNAVAPSVDNTGPTGAALVEVVVPETLSTNAQVGKLAFEAKCAACHGANAAGQDGVAPPLVHKIYEPSHHGDASFLMAAKNGVRAHHWRFGNMPPVEGVTDGDVKMIVAYVRELQRANGIN
jgi:mono/diheme cytochrome c family protein